MVLAIEWIVYVLFLFLMIRIVRENSLFEAWFILISIIIVATGEILNLFVYKATEYTDKTGIPLYIILGGALIAWTYLKLSQYLAVKLDKDNLFMQIVLFLFLSILFPLIEIAGIKANLWYWLKPCQMRSICWWFGVWKFYMIFLGTPVLIALSLISLKSTCKNNWPLN